MTQGKPGFVFDRCIDLIDLKTDPEEFHDLGKDDKHQDIIDRLYAHLRDWGLRMSQRVTMSDETIENMRGKSMRRGILPFLVDGSEVAEELSVKYRGAAKNDYTEKSK